MRSALVITGIGVVGPDGSGPVPVTAAGHTAVPGVRVFPAGGFDPEAELGRRTTRFNHRSTLLAVAACGAALRAAGLDISREDQNGIGVTLGTMCGSLTGTVAFGWETFAQPRPYNVDPSSFPNLVINTAAGAAAIKHGLRGPNSTVVGGPVAGINALRHAVLTLRAGHASTVLVGASEECGVYEAWFAAAARPGVVLGEGAAILVLECAEVASRGGRAPIATVRSVLTRAIDVADPADLRALVTDALATAGIPAGSVRRLALRITGSAPADAAAVSAVAFLPVPPTYSEHLIGDCYSAHAAIQLADMVVTALDQDWSSADAGVVLALDPDGLAGAAVLAGPPAPDLPCEPASGHGTSGSTGSV
jgi:3-oxoacyl-[acyl-carrier-protein] synthase II